MSARIDVKLVVRLERVGLAVMWAWTAASGFVVTISRATPYRLAR